MTLYFRFQKNFMSPRCHQPFTKIVYAGISLTGYHLPRANPRTTNFFQQNPRPKDSFSVQNSGPRLEKGKQNPHPEHSLPSLSDKISMKKEHNSIRAVSFQIFHDCPFDNFLFENHSPCGKPRYSSVTMLTFATHIFKAFLQTKYAACFTFPRLFVSWI